MDEDQLTAALLGEKMKSAMWRLTCGLIYRIIPGKEGVVPYEPRPEHVAIFKALIEDDVKQLVLLKARRPGFSTAVGLYMLDFALFNPGVQCSLIDQNAADATKKLDRIICVALDNLPDWLKRRVKVGAECGLGAARNGEHLSLQLDGQARSDIYAGMNARGGTNDLLHISEWGVIQAEDAPRSAKIRSGALPSARHGKFVIETTWAGGKNGDVWELIEPVMQGASDDVTIQFCPWWVDPRNTDETAMMDDTSRRYFAKMDGILREQHGITLTDWQKRWWAKEKRTQGVWMSRENPSVLMECWEALMPGSIYGEVIDRARAEGRLCAMPVDGRALVHTAWDLGAPRQTRVIYFQIIGEWIHVIDCDPVTDETLVQRVARMRQKGYAYGSHYFPHDSMQTKTSGYTLATEFAGHWLKVDPELIGNYDALTGKRNYEQDYRKCGIRFVPRTADKWVGINYGLQMFPGMKFRAPQCEDMLSVLSLYRVAVVKDGQPDSSEPVHDFSSHLADCVRTLFEGRKHGLIEVSSPRPPVYGQSPGEPGFDPWAKPAGQRVLVGPGVALRR